MPSTYLDAVPPTSPTRRVSGQYVARARLNRQQRAELAAALVDGSAEVFPPTVKQAATLAGVPPFDVTKVRRRNGKPKRSAPKSAETLAAHIMRFSPAERVEAVRDVGLEVVWEAMIVPVVTADREAE